MMATIGSVFSFSSELVLPYVVMGVLLLWLAISLDPWKNIVSRTIYAVSFVACIALSYAVLEREAERVNDTLEEIAQLEKEARYTNLKLADWIQDLRQEYSLDDVDSPKAFNLGAMAGFSDRYEEAKRKALGDSRFVSPKVLKGTLSLANVCMTELVGHSSPRAGDRIGELLGGYPVTYASLRDEIILRSLAIPSRAPAHCVNLLNI